MDNHPEPSTQKPGGGKIVWIVIGVIAVLALLAWVYVSFFRSTPRARRNNSGFAFATQITYAAPMTFNAPILPGASSSTTTTAPTSEAASTTVPPTATVAATAGSADTPTVAAPNGPKLVGVETLTQQCYAGPGIGYVQEYAIQGGVNVLVLGRSDTGAGTWYQVRATSFKDYCWIQAQYIYLNGGDPSTLAQAYPDNASLPMNAYYPPLSGVTAVRNGDQVTISWTDSPVPLNMMQSPTSPYYLVELWTCHAGQLVFTPVGLNVNHVTVTDQTGCSQPSHGRLFLAVLDGYVGPTGITWPPYVPPTATPSVAPTAPTATP